MPPIDPKPSATRSVRYCRSCTADRATRMPAKNARTATFVVMTKCSTGLVRSMLALGFVSSQAKTAIGETTARAASRRCIARILGGLGDREDAGEHGELDGPPARPPQLPRRQRGPVGELDGGHAAHQEIERAEVRAWSRRTV